LGQLLQEVEDEQSPEWKDITDCSPIYKSYCVQWKLIVARDSVLEHHWDSADGRMKTVQIVIHRRKVKEMSAKMHGDIKTLDKVRWQCYWLHSKCLGCTLVWIISNESNCFATTIF
jgi:hypothetical protein